MANMREDQKEKAREERRANRAARMKAERAAGRERGLKIGYAQGALDVLSRFLGPADRVFDCGANVGDVTAQLVDTGAQITCFEPDPFCFEKLTERFGATANVTLRQEAVFVRAGKMAFSRHKEFEKKIFNTQAGTLVQGNRNVEYDEAGIEVDVIDFVAFLEDDIEKNGPLSVLKMDIEGSEIELLPVMLERGLFDQIKLSLIETHEVQFPNLIEQTQAIRAAIAARYPSTKVCLDWI